MFNDNMIQVTPNAFTCIIFEASLLLKKKNVKYKQKILIDLYRSECIGNLFKFLKISITHYFVFVLEWFFYLR